MTDAVLEKLNEKLQEAVEDRQRVSLSDSPASEFSQPLAETEDRRSRLRPSRIEEIWQDARVVVHQGKTSTLCEGALSADEIAEYENALSTIRQEKANDQPLETSAIQHWREAIRELTELADKKQHDYGTDDDPFSNIRSGEEFGVPAWANAVLRANDKMTRLKNVISWLLSNDTRELKNESVEDSLIDLANYCLISLALYRENK